MAKKNTSAEAKTKDSTSVYIRGILTDAFYGVKDFKKGRQQAEKYRISIKANREDMDKLAEVAAPYYEDTDEQWIPKWFKDKDCREFLNLSSNFDIKTGYRNPETGAIDELGDLTKYIAENGNINGSKVILMVTVKEGAVYPASLLIKELKHVTIADMFADFDDDLPFC